MSSAGRTNAAAAAPLLAAASVAVLSITASSVAKNESKKEPAKLEVYLMDRIAKKTYLNNPSVRLHKPASSAAPSSRRYYRNCSNELDTTDLSSNADGTRPKGVPARLRILAIDVPQFKQDAFNEGICQLPSKIFETDGPTFSDGVARSKRIDEFNNPNVGATRRELREARRPIEQKSLAQMLYYCYGSNHQLSLKKLALHDANHKTKRTAQQIIEPIIGVEILEASISNLNPNNIRRTYTSKSSYKYDPGKYAESTNEESDEEGKEDVIEAIADVEEAQEDHDDQDGAVSKKDNIPDIKSGTREDTRTAPWNQYAWLEEIHLRVRRLFSFIYLVGCFALNVFSSFYLPDTWSSTVQCTNATIINFILQHLWSSISTDCTFIHVLSPLVISVVVLILGH